jgi:hypothetical protein
MKWKTLKMKRLTRQLSIVKLAAFPFPAVLFANKQIKIKLKYLLNKNLCERR